ncbi:heavy metal translocating P-type ATPase [Halovenus sp. HT40]|uniref:heavy metal translocating P-type ATPase n=1 Tax=Halovenus sp. HT40 TaxID=3126691 RepID=UPI00300ED227
MTSCTLCDLPADPPVTDDAVDGSFCCRGCLEIYRSLGDVDPDSIGESTNHDGESDYPDDAETTYLAVDGMHCSTCELFLEDLARREDGVHDANGSYAAETVKVVYDPETLTEGDIAETISGLGYRARARGEGTQEDTDLASRLLVGGIFSMMAMVWYALFLYPTYFGFDPIVELGTFDGAYVYGQLAVVTGIVLLYTGRPMLRGAYVSLRTGRPNVDLLVSVAAAAAYAYSTGRLLTGGADLYYDVTLVVVMAVTIGNYYETRIKRRTAGLLADLTELRVTEATRENGETVPVEDVAAGDRLLVKPGERVPVDGTVVEGTAAIDEALVTGESIPETKGPGDSVRGGTVVTDEPLVIEAGADAESTLDRIVGMLWEVQATRPGAQRIADRIATVFVPLVLAIAAVVTAGSLVLGATLQQALLVGLTVVIVSCPCALGLATPLAIATGLQAAADRGIVVATAALFEEAPDIETVVFDKTGTLTTGEMTVTAVEPAADVDEETLLARAAGVEQYSTHPIAEAITDAVDRPADSTAETFADHTRGVSGTTEDSETLVGHPELFTQRGWSVPDGIDQQTTEIRERGDVPVLVGWDGRVCGVVAVGDQLRPETPAVLDQIGTDRRVVVLTGDDRPGASRLESHPAVDTVFAGVPPDGKTETIRRLAAEGRVAMVGDGSNDAPALAAADVGIALSSGTQLATDAADAVILDDELENVPTVFETASLTNRRIKGNIAWAFLYNGVAIPLAISGFLNPLFAAVAMATSSLFVVANSARGHDTGDTAEESSTTAADNRPESPVERPSTA